MGVERPQRRPPLVGAVGPSGAAASSHREAPLIADDPAADNTDVYAFVSPDKPDTVTIIANYIPFEDPAGGPNYYRFDPTVLYELHVDNDGDARDDVTYQFRFKTSVGEPEHVPLQHGTGHVADRSGPERQADVLRDARRRVRRLERRSARTSRCRRRTSGRARTRRTTRSQGVVDLGGGRKVFAGPRDDPFFVDLGSIFDLGGLRPFNARTCIPLACGRRGRCEELQHAHDRDPGAEDGPAPPPPGDGIIGVYASASRQKIRVLRGDGTSTRSGRWVQVSRLGNPLVNEVVIPLGKKDLWNASDPEGRRAVPRPVHELPELAGLVNLLYPVLPDAPTTDARRPRRGAADGRAPALNFTGRPEGGPPAAEHGHRADGAPESAGSLAGDFQGFPNGRRLADDVTDIELRAVACGYGPILQGLLGLCNLTPNNTIGDGVDANENAFASAFPYVARSQPRLRAHGARVVGAEGSACDA